MRTTHETKLIGVLCHPFGANLFHEIFSIAGEVAGMDVAPFLFDTQVKDLAEPLSALRALRASGAYLTGRIRSGAQGLVDYLSDEAHGTGIINTITFDGDEATGHNTEAQAIITLLEPFREQFAYGRVVILGGGAIAHSAAYAVIRHFRAKQVTIADRTLQQAQILKQLFTGLVNDSVIEAFELFPPDIAQQLAEARLIINAMAIGGYPDVNESPITLPDLFHNRQIVLDTNYSPAMTRLLNDASSAGAHTINGLELLIRQVGYAYELLTETKFPEEEIRSLLISNAEEVENV